MKNPILVDVPKFRNAKIVIFVYHILLKRGFIEV
jgi:hypothetical protein